MGLGVHPVRHDARTDVAVSGEVYRGERHHCGEGDDRQKG